MRSRDSKRDSSFDRFRTQLPMINGASSAAIPAAVKLAFNTGYRAMFCSECGKSVAGKFCSSCGARMAREDAENSAVIDLDETHLDCNVQYETILRYPGVREMIERHARRAKQRVTGEQFLSLADNIIPLGVPLEKLAAIAMPIYARLGIKTGKERSQQVPAPAGRVLVRVLCSLARNGQTVRGVTQANDGCLIEASLPSDLFSLEGDLLVSVERHGSQANVRGATCIRGQIFDWGKSNRCLDKLFADLTREAA